MENLKSANEKWEETWIRHSNSGVVQKSLMALDIPAIFYEDEDVDEELLPRENQVKWMRLAENLPNASFTQAEFGSRDFDEQHQWYFHPDRYHGSCAILTFLTVHKDQRSDDSAELDFPELQITNEQQKISQLLKMQIESLTEVNFRVRSAFIADAWSQKP